MHDPQETVRDIIAGQLPSYAPPKFMRDAELHAKIDRIQDTLDNLLASLADEPDDQPATDLEGNPVGGERDSGQPL